METTDEKPKTDAAQENDFAVTVLKENIEQAQNKLVVREHQIKKLNEALSEVAGDIVFLEKTISDMSAAINKIEKGE